MVIVTDIKMISINMMFFPCDDSVMMMISLMMVVTFSAVNFLISLVACASRRWKLVVRVRTWSTSRTIRSQ